LANGNVRVFVKGGPEIVIEQCSEMLNSNGQNISLKPSDKNKILNVDVVK